ncbi:MAG: crotonase/enoyl-CoA hydratase family protein [Acidimicrobiia bacterium]|nr:crotonase/enoyl-CoA hydratase family protein [Acidimicrobiia bacterium]
MTEPHLLFERDGHVAIVTLNRPERKNALSMEMMARMYDAWVEIDGDPDIRAAVVTGAGGDFCAGMDLKAFAGGFDDDPWQQRMNDDPDLHWKALLRHFKPSKPLVAAVEGYAVAGGTEILQAMDLRVAAEGATFGITEVRRGLFPLGGSTVRLSRQIPYTLAAELLLTGRHLPATEAREIGLVGSVVPDGRARDAAVELAHQIAANAPLSVQAVLRSLRETREMTEADGLAFELEIGFPIVGTEDAKEGARAFAEKREPRWQGH